MLPYIIYVVLVARTPSARQIEVLGRKHRRGGLHLADRGGSPPRTRRPPREHRRPPLCPTCGRDNGDFGTQHRLTGRVCVGGYKRLAFHDVELLASEIVALNRQLRRALAELEKLARRRALALDES